MQFPAFRSEEWMREVAFAPLLSPLPTVSRVSGHGNSNTSNNTSSNVNTSSKKDTFINILSTKNNSKERDGVIAALGREAGGKNPFKDYYDIGNKGHISTDVDAKRTTSSRSGGSKEEIICNIQYSRDTREEKRALDTLQHTETGRGCCEEACATKVSAAVVGEDDQTYVKKSALSSARGLPAHTATAAARDIYKSQGPLFPPHFCFADLELLPPYLSSFPTAALYRERMQQVQRSIKRALFRQSLFKIQNVEVLELRRCSAPRILLSSDIVYDLAASSSEEKKQQTQPLQTQHPQLKQRRTQLYEEQAEQRSPFFSRLPQKKRLLTAEPVGTTTALPSIPPASIQKSFDHHLTVDAAVDSSSSSSKLTYTDVAGPTAAAPLAAVPRAAAAGPVAAPRAAAAAVAVAAARTYDESTSPRYSFTGVSLFSSLSKVDNSHSTNSSSSLPSTTDTSKIKPDFEQLKKSQQQQQQTVTGHDQKFLQHEVGQQHSMGKHLQKQHGSIVQERYQENNQEEVESLQKRLSIWWNSKKHHVSSDGQVLLREEIWTVDRCSSLRKYRVKVFQAARNVNNHGSSEKDLGGNATRLSKRQIISRGDFYSVSVEPLAYSDKLRQLYFNWRDRSSLFSGSGVDATRT